MLSHGSLSLSLYYPPRGAGTALNSPASSLVASCLLLIAGRMTTWYTYLPAPTPDRSAEDHGRGKKEDRWIRGPEEKDDKVRTMLLSSMCMRTYMSMIIAVLPLFPLQPAGTTHLLHSIYAVLLRVYTHARDARTATVHSNSVEGQRGRITSLAVPCLEAASHPALRNPHVHFPISCYLFCFLLRGNSTRLVPEAGPIARHQPARHPVLSNAQVPSGPRFTAQASPCT